VTSRAPAKVGTVGEVEGPRTGRGKKKPPRRVLGRRERRKNPGRYTTTRFADTGIGEKEKGTVESWLGDGRGNGIGAPFRKEAKDRENE